MTSTQKKATQKSLPDNFLTDAIAILDFGSQYSQLIARRIREAKTYSELFPFSVDADELKRLNPKGIILSGGPNSCYDEGAPKLDKSIWKLGIPVLGVCYGMQLMALDLGGKVSRAKESEYGRALLTVVENEGLFEGVEPAINSWMSHGDSVTELPNGFRVVAKTANTPVAAIADEERGYFGVQFHPEVVHTQDGQKIIENFVKNVCKCTQSWTMDKFVDEAIEEVRARVGKKSLARSFRWSR